MNANQRTIVQYITLNSMMSLARSSIMSVYVPFLLAQGLNLLQAGLVNTIYFLTLFICEIPTGAFADIFGRKSSFVISCIITSIGAFMYAHSTTFWGCATSESVEAIGTAFASGAFKAWLVDKLQHHEYKKPIIKVFSKSQIYELIVGIISIMIGSYLSDINIKIPFMFLGSVALIAGIIAFFWLEEEYFIKQIFSFNLGFSAMKETVRQSFEYGIKNKVVKFLVLTSFIQILAVQALNMQWTPYFLEYLGDKKYLGYLGVGIKIGVVVGSLIATKFLLIIKDERKALNICQLLIGSATILITLLPFPLNAIMFIIHEIPRGMFGPLKEKFLQDNIPTHARATISSFESISPNFGAIIGLYMSGYIATEYGIQSSWIISGLIMIALTMVLTKKAKAG